MGSQTRRMLFAAAAAGILWLASGLIHTVVASIPHATQALRLLVPSPTNSLFWAWPAPWSFLALALAGASVAAVVFVVMGWVARRRAPGFAAAWFASVAAGAVVGLFIDGVGVLDVVQSFGARGLTTASIDYAVVGAYWGLVQGWIPALIASRGARESVDGPRRRHARWTWAVAAAVLVAFVVAGTAGRTADRTAVAEAQARADAETQAAAEQYTGFGAVPDPEAVGTPAQLVAPTSAPRDPLWCTPEQATAFVGGDDAATGHRGLSIRLMNFSDAPCIVEGYPDVAFADQNGHALDVRVERGSSFMATDAGAQPVEVPAGGYAIAFIGWNANSTAGALVASSVLVAQVAGDQRNGSAVSLDITAGSTVEVTAWELDALGDSRYSDG